MTKFNKQLLVLLAAVIVLSLAGCPAPDGSGAGSSSELTRAVVRATTPSLSVVVGGGCSFQTVTVYYSSNFGAVKTLEIYQAGETGSFVKIATLTGITGPRTYYTVKLANGHYRFYVRALRAGDNIWYTSPTFYMSKLCSSDGNGSSSGGPGPGSSSSSSSSSTGSSSGGPGPN